MTRLQILILVALAAAVCIVFSIAAVMIRSLLMSPVTSTLAEQPETAASPTLGPTATWTPIPTSTFTPPPTDTRIPTPTYTRVVVDTATPTPSQTPTITPTPTETHTPTPAGRGSGSRSPAATLPTPTPTSRYPLHVMEEPQVYTTTNHFMVVLARVTSGNVLLPGYRMVGTHSPTGADHRSEPSCGHLCKASGPGETFLIQEGNLVFEAPFYETGTWSLMLVDPQGQQATEVLEIELDGENKKWFFYHFGR